MIFEDRPLSKSVVQILGLRDIRQHQQGSCPFFNSLAKISGCSVDSRRSSM